MDELLVLNKIVIICKTMFKDAGYNVTYNEFLIIIAISKGYSTLKELVIFLLMDKTQICRGLRKLVEKRMLLKNSSGANTFYSVTEEGNKILLRAHQEGEELEKNLPLNLSAQELEFATSCLAVYQETLQKYIYNTKS